MKKILLALLIMSILNISCKKYLDVKPDKKLVIPSSIQDAQALLDNYTIFNGYYPATGDISDDNYFVDDDRNNTFRIDTRNLYVWSKDAINEQDWTNLYQVVLNATIALETVNKIPKNESNTLSWNAAKGAALFYRGYALFHVAQYFGEIYDSATASGKPGIPLRTSSDATVPSTRGTLEESWQHIVTNFKEATDLLPVSTTVPSRPTKAAAWAMLAKTYLYLNQYSKSADAASSCLQLHGSLMDFNSLDSTAPDPFSRFNSEVIFPSTVYNAEPIDPSIYSLDSTLYNNYDLSDLRVNMYFTFNGYGEGFKGSYDGDPTNGSFNGMATDEVLLMRAECYARMGNTTEAMKDLNTLLVTRWVSGTFVPFTAGNAGDALKIILNERRKELIVRGTRWFDLRRLSREPNLSAIPKRIIAGASYSLEPGSSRYTFLIPKKVIDLTGMQQNIR